MITAQGLNWKKIACYAVGGLVYGAGHALPQFPWLREIGTGIMMWGVTAPGTKPKPE